ncbi:MAG: mechanosensitive ion channel family protein [Treponema sp.]|nr:mechanosensitive ion channel family protein [Treponema sp.]
MINLLQFMAQEAEAAPEVIENTVEEVLQEAAPISSTVTEALSNAANETIVKQTSSFVNWIKTFATWENLFKLIGSLLIILAIWIIYKLILKGIKKIPPEKATPQRMMILKRLITYTFYVAIVMYVLSLFGVKFSAIWGAAGIAGVAIGFAAQTSVSNIISGLFVLTEGALKIGDTIIVGDVTGIVDAISLLSVRVHTFDNQMVRIPNSTIINSNLTNNSYHKERRMTINVSIAYEDNMEKALEALKKAPDLCPTVLKDPAPAVWFDGFGDSGINMTVAVWFHPVDFLQTKNDLYIAIKKVLDKAKISIPYNQLDVMIKK